jgi:RNA polymerase sigma factor (sigma-70 family)
MNKDVEIEDLYRKYLPLIRSMISQVGKGFHDQKALENEAYIALWEAHKRFKPEKGANFSTYLRIWVKKYLLEYLKNNSPIEVDIPTERIADKTPRRNHDSTLNPEMLKELTDNEKQCMYLFYNENMTLTEIAHIMNITREQARQLKEKALRRLRAKLG